MSEVNLFNVFKKNISLHKNPHCKRNNRKRNTQYVSNKKIVCHFFPGTFDGQRWSLERSRDLNGKTIKREAFPAWQFWKMETKKRKRFWKSRDAHRWCAAYNAFREPRFYWKIFSKMEGRELFGAVDLWVVLFDRRWNSHGWVAFWKKPGWCSIVSQPKYSNIFFFFLFVSKLKYSQWKVITF